MSAISDREADQIYDLCDRFMREQKLIELNEWLKKVNTQTIEIDIALTWLTATLPCKTRLSERDKLFRRLAESLVGLSEGEELLRGLE